MTRRLLPGSRLVLATHNKGKLREMEDLLRPHAISVVSAGDLGLPEPVEDAPDFAGNARLKAIAATRTGLPALADDSGFCVAALGARRACTPRAGPDRTATLARRCGACGTGWTATTTAAHGSSPSSASPGPTARPRPSSAGSAGELVWPPRGARGFGYDPMFVPAGAAETYGEMDPVRKAATSHRAQAMAPLAFACFPRG